MADFLTAFGFVLVMLWFFIIGGMGGLATYQWRGRHEIQYMRTDVLSALGWTEDTTDTRTWHMLVNAIWTNRVMLEEAGEYRAYAEGAGAIMLIERKRAEGMKERIREWWLVNCPDEPISNEALRLLLEAVDA